MHFPFVIVSSAKRAALRVRPRLPSVARLSSGEQPKNEKPLPVSSVKGRGVLTVVEVLLVLLLVLVPVVLVVLAVLVVLRLELLVLLLLLLLLLFIDVEEEDEDEDDDDDGGDTPFFV